MRASHLRLLQPLRHRDFALLQLGSTVSLLGDGFFIVALAWQVYKLSNAPAALSIVGLASALPNLLCLLAGGVVSDRFDRRLVMAGADLVRAVAIGLVGILSVAGLLHLWQMIVMMPFIGMGDAFFNPASTAIVPDLLPASELTQANAFRGVIRPLMLYLIGPAAGGLLVGIAGTGPAFLVDAASFIVSLSAVCAIVPRRVTTAKPLEGGGMRRSLTEIGEGLTYVRANPWCWATLAAFSLSMLLFLGPWQVIVPFLVKNELKTGSTSLGLIYAVGGAGMILISLVVGQAGLPCRRVTVMYLTWSLGIGAAALFGILNALWQALAVAFLVHLAFAAGEIIWQTLLQELVPSELLGRVSSLDWLVSNSLVPLSFALTGPVVSLIGPRATIGFGSLLGGIFLAAFLLVPGVRDPERLEVVADKGQAGSRQ